MSTGNQSTDSAALGEQRPVVDRDQAIFLPFVQNALYAVVIFVVDARHAHRADQQRDSAANLIKLLVLIGAEDVIGSRQERIGASSRSDGLGTWKEALQLQIVWFPVQDNVITLAMPVDIVRFLAPDFPNLRLPLRSRFERIGLVAIGRFRFQRHRLPDGVAKTLHQLAARHE
jgi:hypothetical protein